MPRQASITQSDVDTICQRLLDGGKVPTLRLVIAEHGSGSQSTVQPLLKDWQRRRQADAPAAQEAALSPDLVRVLTKQMAHDVQMARADLQDRLEASEEEARDLARESANLGAQLAQRETELAALTEQDAVLRGRVGQLETEQKERRGQLRAERQGRVDAEKAATATRMQRDALQQQLIELKERHDALVAEHAQCVERDRQRVDELARQRVAHETSQSRLDDAQRSIDALREALAASQHTERIAIESAAELRGALQAGKSG